MMNLGEIRVRILGVGQPSGWSPSSLYLESEKPGAFKQYLPIKNSKEGWWEIIAPITQHNLDFCERELYMTRGYLLELIRKELKNPFNKNKQKAWFESDLKAIEEESKVKVVEDKAQEEADAKEAAIKLLSAHSREYYESKRKADEYSWPVPDKSEAMFELEEALGGIVDEGGKFMTLTKEDREERHQQELEEIKERNATDRKTF